MTVRRNEELDFIIVFVEQAEDFDSAPVVFQLRSLWTAYCIHKNIDVDTARYDSDLKLVYGAVESNDTNDFYSFEDFEQFMCEYLV